MRIAEKVNLYDKRVSDGIKWLNKNRPGWVKKIKLSKLDLGDGETCILGQAFKQDFTDVVRDNEFLDENAYRLGFYEDSDKDEDDEEDYDLLTAIWYEKIKCMKS